MGWPWKRNTPSHTNDLDTSSSQGSSSSFHSSVSSLQPSQYCQDPGTESKKDTFSSHSLSHNVQSNATITVSDKLSQAGYVLPHVASPVASYVPAVCVSQSKKTHIIYVSGQLPIIDGKLTTTGKVGHRPHDIDPDYAYQLAKVCALNSLAAAAHAAGGLDRIVRVIKVSVFVASDINCTDQAKIANGASDFFGEIFSEGHARSAVGVAVLPLDSPVEVEVIFESLQS